MSETYYSLLSAKHSKYIYAGLTCAFQKLWLGGKRTSSTFQTFVFQGACFGAEKRPRRILLATALSGCADQVAVLAEWLC